MKFEVSLSHTLKVTEAVKIVDAQRDEMIAIEDKQAGVNKIKLYNMQLSLFSKHSK